MAKWIKLHTEILTDPKMGRMSDKLFRRTIELFLLAGREDADGALPSVQDIAWHLRASEKEIRSQLEELAALGVIEVSDDAFTVAHFVERQNSDLTRSEINRRYYEKSKQAKSEIQTEQSLNVRPDSDLTSSEIQTLDIDIDIEEDKEEEEELRESVKTASVKQQKPAPSPKRPYGNYRHVLLTDEEYARLAERFPKDAALLIQKLDNYLENNRKKHYDNHYLTILTWARKDAEQAPKPERRMTFAEIVQKQEAGEL